MRRRSDGNVAIFQLESVFLCAGVGLGGLAVGRLVGGEGPAFPFSHGLFRILIVAAPILLLYGTKIVGSGGVSDLPGLPGARRVDWSDIGALSWEVGWTFGVVMCRKDSDKPVRIATSWFGTRRGRLRHLEEVTEWIRPFVPHTDIEIRALDRDALGIDLHAQSASAWWPERRRELGFS